MKLITILDNTDGDTLQLLPLKISHQHQTESVRSKSVDIVRRRARSLDVVPMLQYKEGAQHSDTFVSSTLPLQICIIQQWRRKLENFEWNGNEKYGVRGVPLENSLVLAHMCTDFGQLCYLSEFVFPCLYFSLLLFLLFAILGGTSPSLNC